MLQTQWNKQTILKTVYPKLIIQIVQTFQECPWKAGAVVWENKE